MNSNRLVLAAALTTTLALAGAGCGASVEKAGEVVVYTSVDQVYAREVFDLFERETGIRVREVFEDYPRNADGGFWHGRALPHEMWIDGVFMGGMFLSRYGRTIGDADYCFNEVTHQIITLASHCRKGNTGLCLHGYDEGRKAEWADPVTGLSPEVWSEGLGWYALILVETLRQLPLEHRQREQVMRILLDLIEGLRRLQDRATGLWYQVVDKGGREDNWHDTSGSAMFVYAIQEASTSAT